MLMCCERYLVCKKCTPAIVVGFLVVKIGWLNKTRDYRVLLGRALFDDVDVYVSVIEPCVMCLQV